MKTIKLMIIALALGAVLAPAMGRADGPPPGCDPCPLTFAGQ